MRDVLVLVVAYLLGAVPVSNVFARRLRGVDLRRTGSGTVSGSGLYRVAGFGPLAVAGLLDIAKGAVAVVLAGTHHPVLAAFAGGRWSSATTGRCSCGARAAGAWHRRWARSSCRPGPAP